VSEEDRSLRDFPRIYKASGAHELAFGPQNYLRVVGRYKPIPGELLFRVSAACNIVTSETTGCLKSQSLPDCELPPLGVLKSVSGLCALAHACIGEFHSLDSDRAAIC
jgi:hypothetical protein